MKISKAVFSGSSGRVSDKPSLRLPEFAFIGRSNVGKSSLINALCKQGKLAHTSSTPGKTQLVNHFLINDSWYLVDLPGYGYAKGSKEESNSWDKLIEPFLTNNNNLKCVCLLTLIRSVLFLKFQLNHLLFVRYYQKI